MEVEFSNKKLLEVLDDKSVSWLPVSAVNSVRRKLTILACAKDERDLLNFKSLNYEKLTGDKKGLACIRVGENWRMVFSLITSCDPNKVSIMSIEGFHK